MKSELLAKIARQIGRTEFNFAKQLLKWVEEAQLDFRQNVLLLFRLSLESRGAISIEATFLSSPT